MRSEQRVSVAEVRAELAAWRRKHGGRGKPIPPRFWAQATELAGRDGVIATARALGLDRARLERRMQGAGGAAGAAREASPRFIELAASEVLPPSGQVTLEVLGRDGERLRLHLSSATTEQLVTLLRAFARRAP